MTGMNDVDWKVHLSKMSRNGEWGTDIELHAAASMLNAEIWTFLNGKWVLYRPRFQFDTDKNIHGKFAQSLSFLSSYVIHHILFSM